LLFGRDFLVPPGRQAMELRSSEGAPVTVSESDRPISDRKGERIGMVKVFQDLTEIEELRERILQKESLAAVGEMAMTVAHEIRNPLGGIRGFAALLARDLGDDDPKLRLVDRIVAGSRALERLVNELLEYTRPLQLRLRPVACRDVVESALALLESARDGVEVENAVPHGLVLHADADKLRQVLLNVLLNAVQALDGAGRVAVEAAEEDGHVAIGVSDTGCGMTQEQLGQVLTPFFTTKEKGTGLGLPVAAKIVEAHSGELELDSEPGCGSTVTLRLPKQV
jgi:signal transduction histidine kinase